MNVGYFDGMRIAYILILVCFVSLFAFGYVSMSFHRRWRGMRLGLGGWTVTFVSGCFCVCLLLLGKLVFLKR